MTRKSTQGFTLVELAIVMIIIGILIGGVLKGQELIHNSKLKATISEMKAIQTANNGFFDIHRAIPGDMSTATTRIPNCNAANRCRNGDGNQIIGTPVAAGADFSGTAAENIQYWKHLALANLLGGVDGSARAAAARSSYGYSHPKASIRGGYNAVMTTGALFVGDYGGPGVILLLTGVPNTMNVSSTGGAALALSPLDAYYIDKVMDDGGPNTGAVTAEFRDASACDWDPTDPAPQNNQYRTENRTLECILFFDLD